MRWPKGHKIGNGTCIKISLNSECDMATLAPSSEAVVAILQSSISYIKKNEFHPILYQAMGALHEYIERQSPMLGAARTVTPSSTASLRPSFSKIHQSSSEDENHVIVSGWMELLRKETMTSVASWEPVLVLLNASVGEHTTTTNNNNSNNSINSSEYFLRITREQGCPPFLSDLECIYLSNGTNISCKYIDFYGEPRLMITRHKSDNQERSLLFRCQTAIDALNWCTEIDSINASWKQDDEVTEEDECADPQEETASIQEEIPETDEYVDQSVEVEMGGSKDDIVFMEEEEYRIRHQNSCTSSKESVDVVAPFSDDQDSKTQGSEKDSALYSEKERDSNHYSQRYIETKFEMDPEPKQNFSGDQKDTNNTIREGKELDGKRTTTSSETTTPTVTQTSLGPTKTKTQSSMPPDRKQQATPAQVSSTESGSRDWSVEQQKKAAAEKRRQEVDLQRKLARSEQKRKDLEKRRKFLETEERKEGLKQRAGNSEAVSNLKRISEQIATVDSEIEHQQAEVAKIKEEIQEHKRRPLETFLDGLKHDPKLEREQLAAAQAQKEQELERQKKEAFERHRQELERQRKLAREEQRKKELAQKRRFLEEEQRKQDLVANAARAEKGTTDDPGLLKKLSNQMSALDEEVEKHRAQQTKKDAEAWRDTEHDQNVARKVAFEKAKQQNIDREERERNFPQRAQSDVDPFAHLSTASAKGENERGAPMSQKHHHTGPAPTNDSSANQNDNHDSPLSPNGYYSHPHHSHTGQQNHQSRNKYDPYARNVHQRNEPGQHTTPHSHHHHHHHKAATAPASASTSKRPKDGSKVYARMEPATDDSKDESGSDMKELRRKILVGWALQPPMMDRLRPLDQLVRSLQKVHPSKLDIPLHTYFERLKTLSGADLGSGGAGVDDKKLTKAVRKVKAFLHTDKLPRDLTEEHQFMCKTVWDVINDAEAEHEKAKEELSWMNS